MGEIVSTSIGIECPWSALTSNLATRDPRTTPMTSRRVVGTTNVEGKKTGGLRVQSLIESPTAAV